MTHVERSFDFTAPVEQVWTVIGDVPSAATCLPGLEIGAAREDGRFKLG